MRSATLEGQGVVQVKKHTTPLVKRTAKQTVSVALVATTTTTTKNQQAEFRLDILESFLTRIRKTPQNVNQTRNNCPLLLQG